MPGKKNLEVRVYDYSCEVNEQIDGWMDGYRQLAQSLCDSDLFIYFSIYLFINPRGLF